MNTFMNFEMNETLLQEASPLKIYHNDYQRQVSFIYRENARSYDLKKKLNGRCTVVVCFFAAPSSQMKYFH